MLEVGARPFLIFAEQPYLAQVSQRKGAARIEFQRLAVMRLGLAEVPLLKLYRAQENFRTVRMRKQCFDAGEDIMRRLKISPIAANNTRFH